MAPVLSIHLCHPIHLTFRCALPRSQESSKYASRLLMTGIGKLEAVLHIYCNITGGCVEYKNLHLAGCRFKKPELEMSLSPRNVVAIQHILRVNILWRRWWRVPESKNIFVRLGQI